MIANRECGDCTQCCQGNLVLKIFDQRWTGRPCQFVGEKGCTIYKDRPKDPCKDFKCGWLGDTDYVFPEWMKPDKSGLILMWKKRNSIPYLLAVHCKSGTNVEALLWLFTWVDDNNVNLEILGQRQKHLVGTKEFKNSYKK
tara:strand:- start:2643 stop:3065 length:423 start_codon:yes stop_codon:yes gene_type:complete